MNTPIALVVAVAALPALKESRAEGTRRYDVPGALLVTAGLGAVVWGVTHATQAGWSTMSTWLLLAAGLVLRGIRGGTPPDVGGTPRGRGYASGDDLRRQATNEKHLGRFLRRRRAAPRMGSDPR